MRLLLTTALLLALASPAAAADGAQQPFTANDLVRVADLSEPAFLPDGSAVLYTLTAADPARDVTTSDLWRADWADGRQRQLTRTPDASEWQPTPSRDGKRVYFLGDGTRDGVVQLWSIPVRGGGARQVSRVPGGISDFVLSPDGKQALVVAELGAAVGKANTPPLVIDRFRFKEDGRGRIDDRVAQLLLLDLKSGAAQQLTFGRFDIARPSWSPDGKLIAYVSYIDEIAERTNNSDVFVMPPTPAAHPRQLSTSSGGDNDPAATAMRAEWSPDSRFLAWVTGGPAKWIYYAPHQLSIADLASGTVREVARIDRFTYHPRWSADGSAVLALIEQDRDTWLAQIDPASGAVSYLTGGARFATGFALGPDGKAVVIDGDSATPPALRSVAPAVRVLADPNRWITTKSVAPTRDVSFRSADGTEIHGLLVLPPPGAVPEGQKPPLVVRVHGGPVYQFSHEFMADWQLLAARGYVVLGVNPRGSSGRGFDFARAIYADWGRLDVADLRAGIDHVLAAGLADPQRVGIGGWSFGGILTNYMIASEPRIKAAVSGAGASHFAALWGTDQYVREYQQELGTPWDNPAGYARLSYPFLKPQTITAPTLFLCAEADNNVPCIGAEQMYQVLKARGLATRLVVYPGEIHTLSVPSYITDRMTRTLEWYDRYLSN